MEENTPNPESQKLPTQASTSVKKRNVVPVVISVLVIIIVIVSVWLALQMFLVQEETDSQPQPVSNQEEVNDAADLKKLENQVNSEELESLEEEIEKNTQDLQEF